MLGFSWLCLPLPPHSRPGDRVPLGRQVRSPLPVSTWSPCFSPFRESGAASGRRRERWGHGEWTAPAPRGCRAQGHASRPARLQEGSGSIPAAGRGARVCSDAERLLLRGRGHAAAAALPFSRMVLEEETASLRTPRVLGRAARLGAQGSWVRAASPGSVPPDADLLTKVERNARFAL